MRRRRSSRSIVGSPLLIGAVTTLVVIVAVYLAYNANNGLPFVPTYDVKVTLPDANSLRVGDEVQIGGTRVGVVGHEAAEQNPRTGAVDAVITLELQKRLQPLPANTTVVVRDRSALGEKYLQLTPGTSSRTLAAGATLALSAATPQPVELDQLLDMLNAPTRAAAQGDLLAYGDALAGRGADLNDAISSLSLALADLEPLAGTLAAPRTQLAALIASLQRAAGDVAPVAGQQRQLVDDLDTTFAALAGVGPSLGASIAGAPATLRQASSSLVTVRPFLARLTRFVSLLGPGTAALRALAPGLGGAVAAGARTLPATPALNRALAGTLAALRAFATDQRVTSGLRDLTSTAASAGPLIADLAAMQTTCNYPTLVVRNLASALAEGSASGTWFRALPIFPYTIFDPQPSGDETPDPATTVTAPNSEGAPAAAPADGGDVGDTAARLAVSEYNHLHATPYPYAAAPGQPAACEAGNQTYVAGQTVIGHAASIAHNTDFTTGDG